MDLSKATCATCPFYAKQYGSCRRFPPIPLIDRDGDETDSRPAPDEDNWCGEHPIRRAAYELAVQAAKEAKPNG